MSTETKEEIEEQERAQEEQTRKFEQWVRINCGVRVRNWNKAHRLGLRHAEIHGRWLLRGYKRVDLYEYWPRNSYSGESFSTLDKETQKKLDSLLAEKLIDSYSLRRLNAWHGHYLCISTLHEDIVRQRLALPDTDIVAYYFRGRCVFVAD